jgi:uncharacterized NAD-dependent epimerase/dehydratase family protein
MPSVESEIKLIETIAKTKVMAIALSHENLSEEAIEDIIARYEKKFQLATTDVLMHGCQKLVLTLIKQFPELKQTIKWQNLGKTPALAA